MGRQARIKKERRISRAAGTLEPKVKLVTGTFRFDDPYADDDCEDCPICDAMRDMGLNADGVEELTPEQAERLIGVMREVRDERGVPAYFADEDGDGD